MELRTVGRDTALASISTFSGGGIGDLGIELGCGVPIISACEILPDRAALIRHNYPETRVFQGDIWDTTEEICKHANETLGGRRPWLVVLSPPCQGMSTNGAGRISDAIEQGKRPEKDERNRLVIPGVDIVVSLQPDWFVLENVPGMKNTVIMNEEGEAERILDLLARRLHPLGYTIRSSWVEFADLGVPHKRRRLITVGCRLPHIVETMPPGEIFRMPPTELHPASTNSGPDQPGHITLREAIGHMPALDARDKLVDEADPYHHIPKWSDDHYFWMDHTPEGESAHNNTACTSCGLVEMAEKGVVCRNCDTPLPRPQIEEEVWKCSSCSSLIRSSAPSCKCGSGKEEGDLPFLRRRAIHGFQTSYRRLKWDSPASTITQNSGVISSDMKGHPDQNRVLSVREILLLSTMEAHPGARYPWDGHYEFEAGGEEFAHRLVRQVVGESIPPLAMQRLVSHLIVLDGRIQGVPVVVS